MKLIWSIISTLMLLCIVNVYAVTNYLSNYFLIFIFIPIYIFINILPSFAKKPTFKLKMLSDGCDLLNMMLITSFVTAITSIYLLVEGIVIDVIGCLKNALSPIAVTVLGTTTSVAVPE